MAFKGFQKSFFEFFAALEQNNNRAWFTDHKALYEEAVVEPALAFIAAMGPGLESISPHFVADPRKSGGSMFRIYRDTRFSKDKTPYKTHMAVQFRHKLAKDVHAPGFYFHANSQELVLAGGIWRPATDAVAKIRQAIASDGASWRSAVGGASFRVYFEVHGESLKRPPRGFPADHPMVEDLKRKDFTYFHGAAPGELLRTDLVDFTLKRYALCKPMLGFLCEALDVPF